MYSSSHLSSSHVCIHSTCHTLYTWKNACSCLPGSPLQGYAHAYSFSPQSRNIANSPFRKNAVDLSSCPGSQIRPHGHIPSYERRASVVDSAERARGCAGTSGGATAAADWRSLRDATTAADWRSRRDATVFHARW